MAGTDAANVIIYRRIHEKRLGFIYLAGPLFTIFIFLFIIG